MLSTKHLDPVVGGELSISSFMRTSARGNPFPKSEYADPLTTDQYTVVHHLDSLLQRLKHGNNKEDRARYEEVVHLRATIS